MDLHLVGGFLGSGKTTAIIGAVRLLLARGQRVGVVTNDQGRFLVDTAFFDASEVPTAEVAGGCFCCRYDDFVSVINTLRQKERPDVVFAEAVGSCADLVATVLKPLATLGPSDVRIRSFSVFADIRLINRWLGGEPLPFAPNVSYIFEKQIEEAGVLVINKTDLLESSAVREVGENAKRQFTDKRVVMQSSLDSSDLGAWLEMIERDGNLPDRSLDIDYERYGAGEAELGWVDCVVHLLFPKEGEGASVIRTLLKMVAEALAEANLVIGHLKMLLPTDTGVVKLSLTPGDTAASLVVPEIPGKRADIIVNARTQGRAEDVSRIIRDVLDGLTRSIELVWGISEEDVFQPSPPKPQHRL